MPYIATPSAETVIFADKTSCLQLQVRVSRWASSKDASLARRASSTRFRSCQECEHDRIARRDFDNIRSYALDDSCAFVAKHDWMRHRVALVTGNHICVAQAGGHDLDQYFVSARGFQS